MAVCRMCAWESREESGLCVLGLRIGGHGGWEICLCAGWAPCERNRGVQHSNGKCVFAQFYTAGLEITPVSSLYPGPVIALLTPRQRDFSYLYLAGCSP
jgi:hypothetical protein